MANNVTVEISLDSQAFEAELLRRLALTSGTEENYERIALEIVGDFIRIGPEIDILDAEIIE